MDQEWMQLDVKGVFVDEDGDKPPQYFVLLSSSDNRRFPIWIGQNEAWAITTYLYDTPVERPLLCNLLVNAITTLGATILSTYITDLRNDTFYANIRLGVGNETKELDARPSDAIALALLVKCPIYTTKDILEKTSQTT